MQVEKYDNKQKLVAIVPVSSLPQAIKVMGQEQDKDYFTLFRLDEDDPIAYFSEEMDEIKIKKENMNL